MGYYLILKNKEMKFAVAALLGAASAIEMEVENAYLAYVAEHGKSYGTEEEFKFRLNLYNQRVAFVREHNANVVKEKPPLVSTTWLTGLMLSTRDSSVTEPDQMPTKLLRPSPETSPLPQTALTGEPRVPLPPQRTKDHADHAGLSPPPVPWKVDTKSPETH